MRKEKLVLGKVFRNANIAGFSFIAPLDMDAQKINRDQVVAVKSANEGTIIAKIISRKKAQDDYYCECENLFFMGNNGKIVDESSYPLMQTLVYRITKIDFARETI